METDLREAMTSGVLVEFCDERGNCVAQSVYLDWRNRPLPAIGDTFTCAVESSRSGHNRKFTGLVGSRQFDVQRDAGGGVSVWVRLVVQIGATASKRAGASLPFRPIEFSQN